jgi:hypothetical protein
MNSVYFKGEMGGRNTPPLKKGMTLLRKFLIVMQLCVKSVINGLSVILCIDDIINKYLI